MTSMRQRLLLVAGWLLAAIGSGIVASGAVAVAGGQVLDRPLRPFTAAEVAALPVVQVGSSDQVEPHASGGLGPTTGEPTEGSDGTDAGSDEPVGTGGSTADTAPDSSSSDASTSESATDSVGPQTSAAVRIVSSSGGQASFVESQGSLVVLWATPSAGYVAQIRAATDAAITVQFSSSLDVWVIEATLTDGVIDAVVRPEPLT